MKVSSLLLVNAVDLAVGGQYSVELTIAGNPTMRVASLAAHGIQHAVRGLRIGLSSGLRRAA